VTKIHGLITRSPISPSNKSQVTVRNHHHTPNQWIISSKTQIRRKKLSSHTDLFDRKGFFQTTAMMPNPKTKTYTKIMQTERENNRTRACKSRENKDLSSYTLSIGWIELLQWKEETLTDWKNLQIWRSLQWTGKAELTKPERRGLFGVYCAKLKEFWLSGLWL
jgi:hypothetical protein